MSDCEYEQLLGAYHDGELDAGTSAQVKAHLATCPDCAAALEMSGRMSAFIQTSATPANEPITPQELRRMHAAVEALASDTEDRPLFRIAGAFSAIAASVLIISGVWLMELRGNPASSGRSDAPAAQAVADFPQAWEQVAMGGYVPPVRLDADHGFRPFETALAYNDREFANDMFLGLSH